MRQQHGRIWVRSRYVIGQLPDLLYELVNPVIVRHERHLNSRLSSTVASNHIILRMNRVGTSILHEVVVPCQRVLDFTLVSGRASWPRVDARPRSRRRKSQRPSQLLPRQRGRLLQLPQRRSSRLQSSPDQASISTAFQTGQPLGRAVTSTEGRGNAVVPDRGGLRHLVLFECRHVVLPHT
jgi:hypothetical protein